MLALCTAVTCCRRAGHARGGGGKGQSEAFPGNQGLPATDLAAVLDGKVEREAGDALSLVGGHDLEALDDARAGLVFEARVLSLGVFADDGKVDVAVAGGDARDGLAEDDGGVDVELLAHGDVPGGVLGALDGGVEDALEADLVAAERVHGAAEEGGILRGVARDVELFKLDGDVGVLWAG